MADNTMIEWADATVNAINGCSVISPGCTHCYAMKLAGTRMRNHPTRQGLTNQTKAGPVWNGTVRLHEAALLQPLTWKRPRRIFWNAHGDTFHESVPDSWIDQVFAICALTPQHKHMILTKRSVRMREYVSHPNTPRRIARVIIDMLIANHIKFDDQTWPVWSEGDADEPSDVLVRWPLPNVWKGVSVEDQRRADERIPDLLATPAAVRFISAEPLLGPVDLTDLTIRVRPGEEPCGLAGLDALTGVHWDAEDTIPGIYGNPDPRIDWVIVGGESGPGARPMHPDWARALRDQCAAAGVPFHFKQWGEWLPWEAGCAPEWESQNGRREDHHALFPTDIDNDPRWDDGIWAVPEHSHWAFQRVGKKAAGRLLDGVEHNGMPGARHG